MQIKSIRIENFRAYRDETIYLNRYTCLVGTNGVGKSTILTALNIFFRDQSGASTDVVYLDEEDFHKKDTSRPIRITVTFNNLSPEAQQDFQAYYRQGELIISSVALWSSETRKAEVMQYGQRMVMKRFTQFFAKFDDGESAATLKEIYNQIKSEIPELALVTSKKDMHAELSRYESAHPELCEPVQSKDQFYGITKGANRLQKYIHWVYLPAVKDATSEQLETKKSALGVLLERTLQAAAAFDNPLNELRREVQARYREILERRQELLSALSQSLDTRIKGLVQSDAHLRVEWHNHPESYISIQEPVAKIIAGESRFSGNMARFGHGLQRAFLIALLHELANYKDSSRTTLILGCEEPELYQHPSQAKHLSRVFQTLASASSQVIVCTHSPYFISARGFEDVRVVRRDPSEQEAHITSATLEQVASVLSAKTSRNIKTKNNALVKLEQALQPSLNEMFFSEVVVLVEGPEDVACITACLELLGIYDDFIRLGGHFVAVGGKSRMVEPLVVAKSLKIPTFVVFDADGYETRQGNREKHEKDNRDILGLCNSSAEPFPTDTFWAPDHVMWSTKIQDVVEAEIGREVWIRIKEEVRQEHSLNIKDVDKHSLFIAYCLTHAWGKGARVPSLERLCNAICAFASAKTGRHGPDARPAQAKFSGPTSGAA